MAAAVGTGLSVLGNVLGGVGKRKEVKRAATQTRYAANMMTPAQIMAGARTLDPWLYGALSGQRGSTGYQQAMYNIIQQPGYIDPALMNAAYQQSAERQAQDLMRAQGMIGRMDPTGTTGMGQAYAFANLAARTSRDVDLGRQFAALREQQRRADIDWISQQRAASQAAATGLAQNRAQMWAQQPVPPSWASIGGGTLAGGLGAYGGFKGLAGGQSAPISTGSWGQGMQMSPNAWQQSPYPNLMIQR